MTTPLQQAAQELIDRWDSPMWRYQQATTDVIAELRKALDAELAQSVEPVAYGDFANGGNIRIWTRLANCENIKDLKPLYLHPPQPQATTPVPDGYVLVPKETLIGMKGRVNTLATLSLKAERYSVGISIKQTIADILAAAQGEKP